MLDAALAEGDAEEERSAAASCGEAWGLAKPFATVETIATVETRALGLHVPPQQPLEEKGRGRNVQPFGCVLRPLFLWCILPRDVRTESLFASSWIFRIKPLRVMHF